MSTYPDFEKFNLMKQEQTIASDSTSPQLLSKEEQTAGVKYTPGPELIKQWEAEVTKELRGSITPSYYHGYLAAKHKGFQELSRVEGERDELRKENEMLKDFIHELTSPETIEEANSIHNAEKFLLRLIHGGQIVSSNDCDTLEISIAQAQRRFLVINSFGFILRPTISNSLSQSTTPLNKEEK